LYQVTRLFQPIYLLLEFGCALWIFRMHPRKKYWVESLKPWSRGTVRRATSQQGFLRVQAQHESLLEPRPVLQLRMFLYLESQHPFVASHFLHPFLHGASFLNQVIIVLGNPKSSRKYLLVVIPRNESGIRARLAFS
jgi:hypothetical protein